jgi:HSP20 family protein
MPDAGRMIALNQCCIARSSINYGSSRKRELPMATTDITRPTEKSASRPRDVFATVRDEMERVFDQFERGFPNWPSLLRRRNSEGAIVIPELDVRENNNTITVEAELPGVDEKDVSVTVANGMLTIKGEKKQQKEEKTENYYLAERSYGAFERSLRLPDSIDDTKVEAKFDKGVLKVTAAKKPEAVKVERRIEIKKA